MPDLLCVDYELGHEAGALDLDVGPARFTHLAVPTWDTASPRPPRRDHRLADAEAAGQRVLLTPNDGQLSLL